MKRYKLTLAYDGTNYCGWQVQKQKDSIQALLQRALETTLRHPLDLSGSGRTDAGVHALGQTAHFDTAVSFESRKLRLSLNALLPPDIRVLEIEPTPLSFHARYSAKSKIYHYDLHLDRTIDPFTRLYRTQILKKLDLELLQKAAMQFLGTHDFTSFANEPKRGSAAHDPIRTLSRLDLSPIPQGARLIFQADGFLYKMVRNITGTLIACASGKLSPHQIPIILAAKDRRQASATAPPQGLFLMKVLY